MKLTADYHTHTVYSDGKNTLMENFMQAKKVGLSAIGCTEHGFSHVFFGLRRKKLPQYIRELRAAEAETGVKGLLGLENNLRGMSGLCDYTEKDLELFDLYVMGIHVLVDFEKMRDSKLGLGSLMRTKLHARPSKSLVKFTTKAYINAIKNNPIDVITHLNYQSFCDVAEVAKAARDYGTYIELNSKKVHLSDEEVAAVRDTGVHFIIDSDAHSVDRIGDTALVDKLLERVDIPRSQIDNIDGKKPQFRFREYKERNL